MKRSLLYSIITALAALMMSCGPAQMRFNDLAPLKKGMKYSEVEEILPQKALYDFELKRNSKKIDVYAYLLTTASKKSSSTSRFGGVARTTTTTTFSKNLFYMIFVDGSYYTSDFLYDISKNEDDFIVDLAQEIKDFTNNKD
ncbi:MAG: hypothetical protein NT007_12765 [Candidatus Kapabacteria bacterium]|nr:hypothetical protein [Candidatus Kapabacteria bacterium]